eukprot:s1231_g1.t1
MNGICGGKNFKLVDEIYKEDSTHKKLEIFTEFNTALKGLSAVKVHEATSDSSAPSLGVNVRGSGDGRCYESAASIWAMHDFLHPPTGQQF